MVVKYIGLEGAIRSPELVLFGHFSNPAQRDEPRYPASYTSDVQLNPPDATFSASIVWKDAGREHLDDDWGVEEGDCRQSLSRPCLAQPSISTCVDCWSRMSHTYVYFDNGMLCHRCGIMSQRAQQHLLSYDGSKLADLMADILPPSHTIMHQERSIRDCVQKHVQAWDYTRPVEVFLTSGYGHPLPWVLHEFQPAIAELLCQYQYFQDIETGLAVRSEKWSPPLGIVKLHTSDVWRFEEYLDELMAGEHLLGFASTCFEEESQFNDFQAMMLGMMCELYLAKIDRNLQRLLHKLIRMIIITYIMGHTLTITTETLPAIHKHLKHRGKPAQLASRTSPRLANRQLKFFLHVLREKSYQEVLRWQQETLQMGGDKDSTWLPAFCVMLVLAMVLEETQRTIQIQADAKFHKVECSFDDAQIEARNACERIDVQYALLTRLFQHKYRDQTWVSEGSFGPHTPLLRDAVEHSFCRNMKDLLVRSESHLRCRKDVTFSSNNQCQYTSRLVGRFLMPFSNNVMCSDVIGLDGLDMVPDPIHPKRSRALIQQIQWISNKLPKPGDDLRMIKMHYIERVTHYHGHL